jgi:hypothetical protein
MPDDFQAMPPADKHPTQGLPAYDRFADVNLRKPDRWWLVAHLLLIPWTIMLGSMVGGLTGVGIGILFQPGSGPNGYPLDGLKYGAVVGLVGGVWLAVTRRHDV